MTLEWRDGQFHGREITDAFVASQVAALRAIKTAILADCEVASVLLPDDLSVLALKVLELVGNHSLDPVYLARHALKLCTRMPAVQSLGLACFAYSLDRGDAEAVQQRLNMVLINAPTADG